MRADGTDAAAAHGGPGGDESPDWASDGHIAFSSNRGGGTFQLWAMDADGSNVVRLSAGGQNKSEPSWSPDATRIVYVSDGVLPLGNTEIYVANVDGTGVQRLTNYDGRDDFPAWSPDGTKVLFTRGVTFRAQDVFTADTDGSHLAKLTQTAAQLEITDALADQPRAGRAWAIVVLVDDARAPRRERDAHLPRNALRQDAEAGRRHRPRRGRPLRRASGIGEGQAAEGRRGPARRDTPRRAALRAESALGRLRLRRVQLAAEIR